VLLSVSQALPDVRACNLAAQTLSGEVSQLEQRLKYKKAELKQSQEERSKLQVGAHCTAVSAAGAHCSALSVFGTASLGGCVCVVYTCVNRCPCNITLTENDAETWLFCLTLLCMLCVCLCLQREVSLLEKAAADAGADPAVDKLQKKVAQQRDALAKLDGRVNDIRDRMFADFRWASLLLLRVLCEAFRVHGFTCCNVWLYIRCVGLSVKAIVLGLALIQHRATRQHAMFVQLMFLQTHAYLPSNNCPDVCCA
jgi:hypothetical protein